MRSVTAAASERSGMIFTTIIAQKGIILSERDFLHFGQVAECFPPLRGRRTIARQDGHLLYTFLGESFMRSKKNLKNEVNFFFIARNLRFSLFLAGILRENILKK